MSASHTPPSLFAIIEAELNHVPAETFSVWTYWHYTLLAVVLSLIIASVSVVLPLDKINQQ